MKVLVTGGSCLPGSKTIKALLKKGYQVIATHYSHEIPIEDKDLIKIRVNVLDVDMLKSLFKKHVPVAVVHMAALGDVDRCEKEKKDAWEVNVEGTVNIVTLALKYSSFFIYLSTDYVFDGAEGLYEERSLPRPINYYGLTKLCGEVASHSLTTDSAIVRTSTIYGLGPGRQNFAKLLVEKLSKGEKIKALEDQYTSPTHATLLGEAIAEVLDNRITGILHIAGERLSRYEFAVRVAESLGLDKSLIAPARMQEFSWIAPRPRDSSLKCEKTMSMLKTSFHMTHTALYILKEEFGELRMPGT
ncbi:MAG: dTDP-4-dehydrorhamnose reductase [Candidatus Caldarchaeum sp.]